MTRPISRKKTYFPQAAATARQSVRSAPAGPRCFRPIVSSFGTGSLASRSCVPSPHCLQYSPSLWIRYDSDIPRQVGLAGSSGIIVATLRCLMEFYDIEIPIEAQPTFVLSVEQEELGITAGLQDRVIQCYEGVIYMDFAKER